jgi:hypothetical protein
MTHTQRAEKMVQTMLLGVGDGKSYFDYFLSQIEEVEKAARDGALEEAAIIVRNLTLYGDAPDHNNAAITAINMIRALKSPDLGASR